jgi:hypothetical protein
MPELYHAASPATQRTMRDLPRMPTTLAIEIIGWIGALLILGAYILLTLGRIDGRSVAYQAMNVVGALGFVINSGANGAYPSAVLNVVWMLIGLAALWTLYRKRSST